MGMPPMPRTVIVTTPGPATADPATGNPRPGTPTVVTTKAWLSERQAEHVGFQMEMRSTQDTTISLWTLLVPISVVVTSDSTVEDESGNRFVVTGRPAERPNHRPIFRAAALRLISDMQS